MKFKAAILFVLSAVILSGCIVVPPHGHGYRNNGHYDGHGHGGNWSRSRY